jgi:hypothetical protein
METLQHTVNILAQENPGQLLATRSVGKELDSYYNGMRTLRRSFFRI